MNHDFNSQIIKAPVDILKEYVQKLTISHRTKSKVAFFCEEERLFVPKKDIVSLLWKEWMNDILYLGKNSEEFKKAMKDPNLEFTLWARDRVKNHYRISQKCISKLIKDYGFQFISLMEGVRWKQEIAWAKKFRNDVEDEVAILSNLFLLYTVSDPSKCFSQIIELGHELNTNSEYSDHEIHKMTPHEIADSNITSHDWTPLFLLFARKFLTKSIQNLDHKTKLSLSNKVRSEYFKDRNSDFNDFFSNYMSKYPLSSRILVILKAKSLGMDSNMLSLFEQEFFTKYSDLNLIPSHSTSLEQSFIKWMKTASIDQKDVDREEVSNRLHQIATLSSRWISKLPSDAKDLGGGDRMKFNTWRQSILDGNRPAPSNFITDYMFFLMDNT